MEHSQIREQVRKMHQELRILLSQMEAAEVPTGVTVTPDLTPYVMEIKDESQAERALAAARKLGLTIDDHKEFREYRDSKRYFITKEQGCGFYNHSGVNRTPITLEDFEKLAGIDPLEGKNVEGFYNGAAIYGEHQLIFARYFKCWAVSVKCQTTPHHLTRVTERTVGRFYLIEDSNGDKPYHFGLYLGGKYVRWTAEANYPLYVSDSLEYLTMYEVTPTV